MKVLIASDKFKHSLDSLAASQAIKKGLDHSDLKCTTTVLPIADGGEGMLDVLAYYVQAEIFHSEVQNPLGRPVMAAWAWSESNKTAIIEMARASGLQLLETSEYDVMRSSTFGTGQLIKEAIGKGAKKIIVGIGGSATNDGAMGAATAMGYRFLNRKGHELLPYGSNLSLVHRIDKSGVIDIKNVTIIIACDVQNLLTGTAGAAHLFSKQKGATPEMVDRLEEGMIRFAEVVEKQFGVNINSLRGGGAAGGFGAGAYTFFGAELLSGIQLVMEYSDMRKCICESDIVITGEGKLDKQTLYGKVIMGITELAKEHQKPVLALCGTLDLTTQEIKRAGITAAFSILREPQNLDDAIKETEFLLFETAVQVGSLLRLYETVKT